MFASLFTQGDVVTDLALFRPYVYFLQVDTDGSKEVEFGEFLKVIAKQKLDKPADNETREAFFAMGGNVRLSFKITDVLSI